MFAKKLHTFGEQLKIFNSAVRQKLAEISSFTFCSFFCHLTVPFSDPLKGGFRGGGMFFWDKITNFCPFVIKKILEHLGGKPDLPATNRPTLSVSGQNIGHRNFWKSRFFGFFGQNLHFFFQKFFLPPNHEKWVLRFFLFLKSVFKQFLVIFDKIRIWNFWLVWRSKMPILRHW